MKTISISLLLIMLIPLSVMADAKYDMIFGASAGNVELVRKAFDGIDEKAKIDALMSSSLSGKLNVVKF
ncbi:MAG: hypothetical protein K8S13_18350 [Desulfobacula sp.]|uniref:hypothetical protein n=1 Tax=Desulfobacula sp. TaxID=2593537 RepID=UPI0025C27A83|nr:hypothetical protein [Desulfobacula sp.]MCD4721798.1 hypothetical protein [Desulfobacula sp.]